MEPSDRVAVLGITGFIGSGLPELLRDRGLKVTGVSRSPAGSTAGVDAWQTPQTLDFSGHRAVINLAGAPIATRWTDEARRGFRESRVGLTTRVVEAIRRLPPTDRPRTLINGSAVGIYGDRGDEVLDESSTAGGDFLATLCHDWEQAALAAEELGVRVVLLRTGIVLGRDEGALKKMLPVFKLGLGGKLGSGRQWMPWIHIADARAAILHALEAGNLRGPLNLSAPSPERNEVFTRDLGAALHRPAIFRVPGFGLKLGLGEFGGALLASQRAVPTALRADGFNFQFPALRPALMDLLS
jgi:uncharacterized protein